MPSIPQLFVKHIVEWASCVVLLILVGLLGLLAKPHCRGFNPSDPTIGKPLLSQTFPAWSLVPLGAVLPALCYALFAFVYPSTDRSVEIHQALLMHIQSFAIGYAMWNPIKLYAGRLRPNFLSALDLHNITYDKLADWVDVCAATHDNKVINGERMSFPSGHSGTMFSVMVPLTLYLCWKAKLLPMSQNSGYYVIKIVLCSTPLILATIVAVSRTRDYVHHYDDILAGAIIGIVAGTIGFSINFGGAASGLRNLIVPRYSHKVEVEADSLL